MNNNKLSFLMLPVALVFSFSTAYAQTKVGVKAGVNFSNVRIKEESGNKAQTESTPGILLGLTVDIPIAPDFSLQPAALYSNKGYKQSTGGYYGIATNFKVNVSYIEVPVTVLYKPKLGAGRLLIGAGPYIGYGTGGKWKSDNNPILGDIVTDNHGDIIFKNDFEDGEFGSYIYGKPLDYGAGFTAGYEFFNQFTIQFNAQVGFANLQPDYAGVKRDGSIKNKGYSITVGYKF